MRSGVCKKQGCGIKMSARPRPVTATFPPPVMVDYHPRAVHNGSLSDGSSTASLLSVLDHDSCEISDNEYVPRRSASQHERRELPVDRHVAEYRASITDIRSRPLSHIGNGGTNTGSKSQSKQSHYKSATVSSRASQLSPPREGGNENDESGSENNRLSAWEQWILKKAKEERDKLELELEKMRIENEKAEQLRQEKEKKKMKANEVIQAWIEERDALVKQRLQLAAQRRRAENELKEAKKREVQITAQENFKTWLNKKHAEDAERKRLKQEQKEKEEREKREKAEKCKAAVEKWMSEAKKRPRTAPNSFGFCAGKLTGYYDASAYPAPSYVNPIPWRPIEVPPPPKPVAKKKNQKPRWNPAKYL